MILVLLGTHELPFNRLLEEIETNIRNGTITDNVIAQVGHTDFSSDLMTIRDFISFDEMEKLYQEADLIITHGGTGSIITGIKNAKKVIASARLKKYGEHNDDHQLEIIDVFVENGHILSWDENDTLNNILKKIESFNPKPYESKRQQLIDYLVDYIEGI